MCIALREVGASPRNVDLGAHHYLSPNFISPRISATLSRNIWKIKKGSVENKNKKSQLLGNIPLKALGCGGCPPPCLRRQKKDVFHNHRLARRHQVLKRSEVKHIWHSTANISIQNNTMAQARYVVKLCPKKMMQDEAHIFAASTHNSLYSTSLFVTHVSSYSDIHNVTCHSSIRCHLLCITHPVNSRIRTTPQCSDRRCWVRTDDRGNLREFYTRPDL